MPGPPRKTTDRHIRRTAKPGLELVGDAVTLAQIPAPPPRLLKVTKVAWDSYWTSTLTAVVRLDTDLPALVRLFTLYDERERAYRGYRAERLVEGSQGQKVLNPLARALAVFDTEIRQLEDRFGLTPKARLALGIDLGRARKGLAEVNAELDDDEPEEADDPRAALVLAGEDQGREGSS